MASKRPPTLSDALSALEAQVATLGQRVVELEQQSQYVSAILQREGEIADDVLRMVGGEPTPPPDFVSFHDERALSGEEIADHPQEDVA